MCVLTVSLTWEGPHQSDQSRYIIIKNQLFVLFSVLLFRTMRNTERPSQMRVERQEVAMAASIRALLVVALRVESVL